MAIAVALLARPTGVIWIVSPGEWTANPSEGSVVIVVGAGAPELSRAAPFCSSEGSLPAALSAGSMYSLFGATFSDSLVESAASRVSMASAAGTQPSGLMLIGQLRVVVFPAPSVATSLT